MIAAVFKLAAVALSTLLVLPRASKPRLSFRLEPAIALDVNGGDFLLELYFPAISFTLALVLGSSDLSVAAPARKVALLLGVAVVIPANSMSAASEK